jgi:fructosamine-3-kinase
MMRGEYESQLNLYRYAPAFIPKPLAWAQFASDPKTFLILCDFIEMTESPRPPEFCRQLAQLHLTSMKDTERNPHKFGYDIHTVQGCIPLDNT